MGFGKQSVIFVRHCLPEMGSKSMMNSAKRILFVKPPDRFLENEFSYQQLGPHYLQSYLDSQGICSDILIAYTDPTASSEARERIEFDALKMLLLSGDSTLDLKFDPEVFGNYEIVAFSVMSPQAPDAYLMSRYVKAHFPHVVTVIGGSHPRYYQDAVAMLPKEIRFDFIVPQDGWEPMLSIAKGIVQRKSVSTILSDNQKSLSNYPPPTRNVGLMSRLNYVISGLPAFHTVTALGCPFTCNFCESGREKSRAFSLESIDDDLAAIANVHDELGQSSKALMFFDDVGLLNPSQVSKLSSLVAKHKFDAWRAFTHAYLVKRFNTDLLTPFVETGGKRIGVGLETGSQKSLDLINKRNGRKQYVEEHLEAIYIANQLGVAVDTFTMIFPWEDEQDLEDTTKMIEVIMKNPVNGVDHLGRPLRNYVDSTIMSPYQGTAFYDMAMLGQLPYTKIKPNIDPGTLWYKGHGGGSGWPYLETRLMRERYEEVQKYRNSLRGSYR